MAGESPWRRRVEARRKLMVWARVAAVAVLAFFSVRVAVTSAGELAAQPEVWIESPRWVVDLPEDSTLTISNPLGDVRGRSSGDDKLLVVGIIQRLAPDQDDGEVLISSSEGEVVVRTVYPSASELAQDGRPNGRIDLSVLVPAGRSMDVETRHGLIEIKGIKRDLKVRTGSGRLRVTTGLALSAQTESGELRVVLKNPTVAHPARLATETGELRIDLPDQPKIAIRARTAGQLRLTGGSLAEVPIDREGGVSGVQSGNAPWMVDARSEAGLVEIRALPEHELR